MGPDGRQLVVSISSGLLLLRDSENFCTEIFLVKTRTDKISFDVSIEKSCQKNYITKIIYNSLSYSDNGAYLLAGVSDNQFYLFETKRMKLFEKFFFLKSKVYTTYFIYIHNLLI